MTEPGPGILRWIGTGAALVLAAASWGAGSRSTPHTAILWPGPSWWSPTGGSPLLTAVAILAMAVLVGAWWRLRDAAVTTRWWWATAGAWFVPLLASVPLYSRDLYSYAAQGALWHDGLSPYDHTVRDLDSSWRDSTAPTWLDSTAPYGPVFLLIARAAAAISGGNLVVALGLLRLVAVVGVIVIAWAVADLAGRLGVVDPSRATWLAVATPLVGAHLVSGGHNDAVMVAGILAALACAVRGRFVAASVVVGLAVMVKVTAIVALPFVALLWAVGAPGRESVAAAGDALAAGDAPTREDATTAEAVPAEEQQPTGAHPPGRAKVPTWGWRRIWLSAVRATVVAGATVGLVTLATGLGWSWLNPVATSGKNEQWTSLPTGLGMAVGAVGHVLGHDEWREAGIAALRAVGLVVLAALLVIIWLRAARATLRDDALPLGRGIPRTYPSGKYLDRGARGSYVGPIRALGWSLLAVIVLAPAFLGWYYLWVLPILAVTTSPLIHRRQVTWLAVVATLLCFAQLPDGYSLGLTTTAVGVPLDLIATVLLVRAGWRWLHLP